MVLGPVAENMMRTQMATHASEGLLQDLHIYYIQGRLKPGAEIPGAEISEAKVPGTEINEDGFIGNWEEEDCSFLFFEKPSAASVEKLLRENTHLSLLDEFHMTYEEWLSSCWNRISEWPGKITG